MCRAAPAPSALRSALATRPDRAAVGLVDADVAFLRADLGGAAEPAEGDVAGEDGHPGVVAPVELDRPPVGLDDEVAEPADAPEVDVGGLGLDTGSGGQLDRHLDGARVVTEEPVARLRGRDPQGAAVEGDLGPLRGPDVTAPGGVGRQDLDRGVGPVGGDQPDTAGRDVEDDRSLRGGVERAHGVLLLPSAGAPAPFPMMESYVAFAEADNRVVARETPTRRWAR
jgi:hypothetical protein